MSAMSQLIDIESGPYAAVTEDEIDRAAWLLKDRVREAVELFRRYHNEGGLHDRMVSAMRRFLVSVTADKKQTEAALIDVEGMVDDLIFEPGSNPMAVLADIIDDATAIQLSEIEE